MWFFQFLFNIAMSWNAQYQKTLKKYLFFFSILLNLFSTQAKLLKWSRNSRYFAQYHQVCIDSQLYTIIQCRQKLDFLVMKSTRTRFSFTLSILSFHLLLHWNIAYVLLHIKTKNVFVLKKTGPIKYIRISNSNHIFLNIGLETMITNMS